MSEDAEGFYLDGATARRRPVRLRQEGDALLILEDGAEIARWQTSAIRRIDAPAGQLRFSDGGTGLARIEIAAGAPGAAAFAYPYLRRPVLGAGATMRIVAWSAAAGLSLILCAVYLVPAVAERAAPLVPASFERRLGEAFDGQVRTIFGDKVCADPRGVAALGDLVGKLSAASGLAAPLTVVVLDTPTPNALALPGGRLYLLAGLLARSESVDEIAGVLAHEIGHVAHRDGLRAMLRVGGTSALLGILFGDVFGFGAAIGVAQVAIEGASSRDAEREADRHARDILVALGRPPKALATILSRIAADDGAGLPPFLRSHPLTAERLAALSQEPAPAAGAPLLGETEWQDLRNICRRS